MSDISDIWSLRSPDLTLLKFFHWGFVKDKVFIPPLSLTLDNLKGGIEELLQRLKI